ncbi:MAG: hypothetical protein MJ014_03775 [Methanocorpusculum sp.]|nr:hypothetical protein [Methanocorpusculum sp.]
MATDFPEEPCNVQFSLRVTQSMADEINAQAEKDGVKPATWIRKAIAFALSNMDENQSNLSRQALLELIQSDSEIEEALGILMEKRARNDKARELEMLQAKYFKEMLDMKKQMAELQERFDQVRKKREEY